MQSNSSYAIRYGKVGLLFLSCRRSSNIAQETQATLYTSDIVPTASVSVLAPEINAASALTITLNTNGTITAFAHTNGYGNWIRAVIPFVADV